MPTLLICPECQGVRGATETTEAGPPCRCSHPTPSTTIFGASPGVKICCVCGGDVTGKRRMKDREGRYFCYDCGMQDSKRKHGEAMEMCADCHRPMSKEKMKQMEGQYVCDKCQANRAVRAKREAARIAYAAQEEREDRRRLIQRVVAAVVVVVLIALAIYFLM